MLLPVSGSALYFTTSMIIHSLFRMKYHCFHSLAKSGVNFQLLKNNFSYIYYYLGPYYQTISWTTSQKLFKILLECLFIIVFKF